MNHSPLEAMPAQPQGSDLALRASMAVRNIYDNAHRALPNFARSFAERRGLSEKATNRIVAGAGALTMVAVTVSQRKVLGEIIDGIDNPFDDFVGSADAQGIDDFDADGELDSVDTDIDGDGSLNAVDPEDMDPDVLTDADVDADSDGVTADVDPDDNDDTVPNATGTPPSTPPADPPEMSENRIDAIEDFQDAADDTGRDGAENYNPEDHLDANGQPMSEEDFIAQSSTAELRAATEMANAMDTASPAELNDLGDYLDDGSLNDSVGPVDADGDLVPAGSDLDDTDSAQGIDPELIDADQDGVVAPLDQDDTDDSIGEADLDEDGVPASVDSDDNDETVGDVLTDDPISENRTDAVADFMDAADDTDRDGNPLYNPEDHLDGNNAPVDAQEFADDHSTAELRAATDRMNDLDTASARELHEIADLEDDGRSNDSVEEVDDTVTVPGDPDQPIDATGDTNGDNIPDALEPTDAAQAAEMYGDYASETSVTVTVANGETYHDAVTAMVDTDMTGLDDAQRGAIVANLEALYEAQSGELSTDIVDVTSIDAVVEIPQV